MDSKVKDIFKKCNSIQEIISLLREVNVLEISRSDVDFIYRSINKCKQTSHVKIAYLSNHTVEPLPNYVSVFCACEGIFTSDYIGRFNQYFQAVINTEGDLITFDPNIIFIDLSIREMAPKIYNTFGALSVEEKKCELNRIMSHLLDWTKLAKENTKATILLANFPRPPFLYSGIADFKQSYSESEFYLDLNIEILRVFKNDSRVYIFDLDKVTSNYGRIKAKSHKLYYLAKIEWNDKFIPCIAEEMTRHIKAITSMTKKCVVLDLDKTLWGGIVGEDGHEGIKIGRGDPESEAYLDFQYAVRALKDRGIILAICSKNNRGDVLEVFEKRTEMPLGLNDFAVMEINWEHKHENIAKIAATLNIGTDSIVFIDDSPLECNLVREMMPDVKTIQMPKDPSEYADILRKINDFEKLFITGEDKIKVEQYIQNIKRIEYQNEIGDIKSFLRNLETEIIIRRATQSEISRVHQLFNKTNQFNLTTERYSIGEIEVFIEQEHYALEMVEAVDRFGNLGVIGLYLIELKSVYPIINSFILSCRAMGREIETAMMNQIKKEYLCNNAFTSIESIYIPTSKNKPVDSFYDSQGFHIIEKLGDGKKRYALESGEVRLIDCSWINVKRIEEVNGKNN